MHIKINLYKISSQASDEYIYLSSYSTKPTSNIYIVKNTIHTSGVQNLQLRYIHIYMLLWMEVSPSAKIKDFIRIVHPFIDSCPVYLAPGNHDISNAIGYTILKPERDDASAVGIQHGVLFSSARPKHGLQQLSEPTRCIILVSRIIFILPF